MPGISYLHEKFSGAVSTLATSTKSLQDRLAQATTEDHVILLDGADFPEHLRKTFEKLMNALTNKGQGKINDVVARMSDEEAERNIHLILELSSGLAEEHYGRSGA